MSKRDSKPKPHASERTWRRHRAYHEISTVEDEAHFKVINEIKETAREWAAKLLGKEKPQVNIIKGGR